jgi:hypothetical protein
MIEILFFRVQHTTHDWWTRAPFGPGMPGVYHNIAAWIKIKGSVSYNDFQVTVQSGINPMSAI